MNQRITSNCYKLVEPQSLPQPSNLPDNWLVKLGEFMATAQDYDTENTSMLLIFLNEKAGAYTDYSNKKDLSELLKIIYQGYASEGDGAFNNELKRAIPAQIYEAEKSSCTEGFHDRVLAVISGLTFNESMDGFLSQIREGIVETAARKCTKEVHAHNRFFKVASEQAYGIKAINKKDKYIGAVPDKTIQAKLKESFDEDYQPLSILYKLTDSIRGRLGDTYGYHGKDESGYVSGDYGQYNDFLNRVIGKEEEEEEANYLILDESGDHIIDLNWPLINQSLLSKLCDKDYFKFTPDEEGPLMGLLATTEEDNQSIHLDPLLTGRDPLIKNMKDLVMLISCINPESDQIKLDCIESYINTSRTPMDIGEKIIQLLETSHHIIPNTIKNRFLEEYANDFLMKIRKSGSQYLLITIKRFPIAIPLLMRSINALPSDEKLTFLSESNAKGYNALMLAVREQPAAIPDLIKAMEGLALKDKLSILSKRDSDGRNALMLAARSHPEAIPALIKEMAGLVPQDKLRILSKRNSNGYNALMLAAQCHPEAIPALIKEMAGLAPQDKLSILSKRNSNGYNALMLAAKYSPTAVNTILEANPAPARTHTFEVKTDIPALKPYKGTFLKNKILCLLADEINECSTLEDLKRFKNLIKNRDEYQILKTGQDRTTRFFHLKTSSIAKLEQLIGLKQEKLANEPLNPRARA